MKSNQQMEQQICLNCNNGFTGSFCNQCGQKITHRYTLVHVFHELIHVFTHADKGIFPFVISLIKRPGNVALDFVEGRRKRHFNLFQYLLLIVGFTTYLISKTHFLENTMQDINSMSGVKLSTKQTAFQLKTLEFIRKYFNLVQFLLIPVNALFASLFLGRKKYNYAENVVLQAAISSQVNTFSVILILLILFIPSIGGLAYGICSFVIMYFCFTIGYKQFFKLSTGKAFLFSILIYVCAYIIQVLLLGIIAVSYTLLIKQ